MSELKAINAYRLTLNTEDCDVYIHNDDFGCGGDLIECYIKSEADKVIAELRSKNEGLLYALADAETDLAMATKWRKCSEELPEVNQNVLVADAFGLEDSVTIARYTKEGWDLLSGILVEKDWFKYWMPLPKAPEDK